MFDIDAQTQFAEATTALMRSCAVATAHAMSASACQGLSLWSNLLRHAGPGPVPRRVSARSSYPPVSFWLSPMAVPAASLNWLWAATVWTPNSASPMWAPFAGTWAGPAFSPWPPLTDWSAWSRAYLPAWNQQMMLGPLALAAMPAQRLPTPPSAPFASYRSAGGHAVAQVIAPMTDAVAAGLTATVVVKHMQSVLGFWRAAIRA